MENGVVMETEEGSPQGGNLSPLLANIYLNEFDQEYQKRGVIFVRYADDIVLLAKKRQSRKETAGDKHEISGRAAEIESEPREKPCSQRVCNPNF